MSGPRHHLGGGTYPGKSFVWMSHPPDIITGNLTYSISYLSLRLTRKFCAEAFVQQFGEMEDTDGATGGVHAAAQVHDAARVVRHERARTRLIDVGQFPRQDVFGEFRIIRGDGAAEAAADRRLR